MTTSNAPRQDYGTWLHEQRRQLCEKLDREKISYFDWVDQEIQKISTEHKINLQKLYPPFIPSKKK